MNGIEAAAGRLGAVLRVRTQASPASLTSNGPFVATSLDHARRILTDVEHFDFPADVSRERIRRRAASGSSSRGPRTLHQTLPSPTAQDVERGRATLLTELDRLSEQVGSGGSVDALDLMRDAVARSTTDAVIAALPPADRDDVSRRVLGWIDALGPVIARPRSPGRWSSVRRREVERRRDLEQALGRLGCASPAVTSTMLAAGIQVPVAAAAWLLVHLAEHPEVAEAVRADPAVARAVAWETVRISPPTWLTARIVTEEVELGDRMLAPGSVVMVSPLLLGRSADLVPGPDRGAPPLEEFGPGRWSTGQVRPGAWLPFGAGPHACPGRSLGLVQLDEIVRWACDRGWSLDGPVVLDQSRGIAPIARLGHRLAT